MDILIPDSWLRDYLKTKAKPEDLQKYLSLCGPSVERIHKGKTGPVYSIEVTTNRVDSASVYGIAREAAAILPRFKVAATKSEPKLSDTKGSNIAPLEIKILPGLVNRATAIVLDVENGQSPQWLKDRLEDVGIRSLGSLIDITNYVMVELGHPTHVFDYDRIKTNKLIFRESKKGEKIKTLDGKTHTLPGKDVVIDDGTGKIIDLPGIMGTENSVVTGQTKRVIFFIDNINPVNIRKTSMSLALRTQAAAINEKGVDPELGKVAILRGLQLYKEICNAKIVSKLHDVYPSPYKPKKVSVSVDFINERLGTKISAKEIVIILKSLGFGTNESQVASHKLLTVTVPSYRANDVSIPEDIVEEVARIYGYHNLPSQLMTGALPPQLPNSPFEFEQKAKQALKTLGGVEVYTLSLVSKNMTDNRSLKLKNSLGADSEYLRTSLTPSLIRVVAENKRETKPFYVFEVANVYLPKKGDLPEEKMTLGIIFSSNYAYREAKGIVESFLDEVRVPAKATLTRLENDMWYWEHEMESLQNKARQAPHYTPIPKYPGQVEDITVILPQTYLEDVISKIRKVDSQIVAVDLADTYGNAQTLRITYQNPDKTLTDHEVGAIRGKVVSEIVELGGRVKE